jgi:hypothetical protein
MLFLINICNILECVFGTNTIWQNDAFIFNKMYGCLHPQNKVLLTINYHRYPQPFLTKAVAKFLILVPIPAAWLTFSWGYSGLRKLFSSSNYFINFLPNRSDLSRVISYNCLKPLLTLCNVRNISIQNFFTVLVNYCFLSKDHKTHFLVIDQWMYL